MRRKVGELFAEVEPEDLVKFGLIPEFVGRLPVLATLMDLDVEALVEILKEPKNALVKQYQRLFDMEDVQLTFQDEALKRSPRKPSSARRVRVACARSWRRSCWTPCTSFRPWKALSRSSFPTRWSTVRLVRFTSMPTRKSSRPSRRVLALFDKFTEPAFPDGVPIIGTPSVFWGAGAPRLWPRIDLAFPWPQSYAN
jgi:hypothetical protein